MMMTDEDIIRQLEEIRRLALRDYPYPDDLPCGNPNLPLTLGQIAGLAQRAIDLWTDQQKDLNVRHMRVDSTVEHYGKKA